MAKARLYGWNGERPAKAVSGQKQIVLFGLSKDKDAMRTGKEWAEIIGPDIATRQDPYRVVLYYILGLKNEGCIRTAERDIEAITVNADVKHGVVVKTDSAVEVSEIVPVPETEDEEPDEDDVDVESEDDDEESDDEGAEAE